MLSSSASLLPSSGTKCITSARVAPSCRGPGGSAVTVVAWNVTRSATPSRATRSAAIATICSAGSTAVNRHPGRAGAITASSSPAPQPTTSSRASSGIAPASSASIIRARSLYPGTMARMRSW